MVLTSDTKMNYKNIFLLVAVLEHSTFSFS